MKKLGKLLFHRVVIVGLSILLQVAVMVATVRWLSDYESWIRTFMAALSAVSVVYILYDRTNSSYKIAWLLLILVFPVAGICIYLTFGGRRLSLPARRRMQLAQDLVRENLYQEPITWETLAALSDPAAVNTRYLHHVSGFPVYDNTHTEYFPLGDQVYPRMLEALRQAESYIFLEYFILENGVMWEGILNILKEKAAQGLDVRVMYDDFGCITTLPAGYHKELQRLGIRTKVFTLHCLAKPPAEQSS